jgi:hypothetical protein
MYCLDDGCIARYVADVHGPAAAAAMHSNVRELLYGCQDGRLVQLLVDAGTVRQGFVIPGQNSSGTVRAAVTAIHCGADYSKVRCNVNAVCCSARSEVTCIIP